MRDARDIFHLRGEDGGNEPDHSNSTASLDKLIKVDQAFFVDLGFATWKLQQRMFDIGTGEAKSEFRQLGRHVVTIRDRLIDLGLQIQDHTGNPYDSGQSLEVLAFQPTDGITNEVVIETVRPSLYLQGHRILKGQVIVGSPLGTQEGKK
jgi:hypothetical protein